MEIIEATAFTSPRATNTKAITMVTIDELMGSPSFFSKTGEPIVNSFSGECSV